MRRPVQLRHETVLTSEAYLAEHAWVKARLAVCPRHPRGGCGWARHGTYPRKTPVGMRVTRYYCPTAHETSSLLPDCLASRFPSDLDDLERVVTQVAAARGVEAGVDLRLIQAYLGHTSPKTTALYTHLTPEVTRTAVDPIQHLMDGLV